MDQNYFVQQMVLQRTIQRISTLLAILLLVGVLLLWVHSRFRKSRSRIAALLVGLLLLGSMGVQQAEAAPEPGLQLIYGRKDGAEDWYLPDVRIRAFLETAGERLVAERMSGSSLELVELAASEGETGEEQLQGTGISWMTILSEEAQEDGSLELEFQFPEEGIYHIKRVVANAVLNEPDTDTPDVESEAVTEKEVLTFIIGNNNPEKEPQDEKKEEPAGTDQEESPAEAPATEEKENTPADPAPREPENTHSDREEKDSSTEPAVVDRTAPSIRITGVENAAVYGRPVTPVIHIEDSGIRFSSVKYTVSGARTGSLNMETLADVKKNSQGVDIRMDGFRAAADDVYTLSVQAADLAGNTSQEEVIFSVDQEGSAFILSDATRELVEKYYTDTPEDVVLSEVNTGGVIYELALSRDGTPQTLKEDRDYSVEVRGGDGDWMIYTYRIFADTFREDGVYHLDLTSRDQADHVNNNQIRDARIDFVVDRSGTAHSDEKKTSTEGEKKDKNAGTVSKGQEKAAEITEKQPDVQPEHAVPDPSVTEKQENAENAAAKSPAAMTFLLTGSLITVAAGLYLVLKKERWLH